MTGNGQQDITGDYNIDPAHSNLGFVVRHAMITKVRGRFSDVEGTLHIDATAPKRSHGHLTIKTASVDTRQEQRDEHLRSADFFDVENYPEITFRSTSIEPISENNYRVTGDLTIRGTTRPVSVDVEFTGAASDPMGNDRVGFEGSVQVNRKDWGLTWNAALETGGVLLSEKVTLELDISAIKQSA
ncbi:YceI family protein [Parasphingorhabdus pacifica]